MNTMSLDQLKTKYYGEVGEPERDRLEHELALMRCTTLDELFIGCRVRKSRNSDSQ